MQTNSSPILDGELNHMRKADHRLGSVDTARRDLLKMMGLFAAGTNFFWPEALFQKLALADEQKPPAADTAIGRREIIMGLDGMSRVADAGNDPFVRSGITPLPQSYRSAFFCRNDETLKRKLRRKSCRSWLAAAYQPDLARHAPRRRPPTRNWWAIW